MEDKEKLNEEVEFTVKCKMSQKWMNVFCSMLTLMQKNGAIGHSEEVSMFCDGDGDFRPKFKIDKPFNLIKESKTHQVITVENNLKFLNLNQSDYKQTFEMSSFDIN